MNVAAQHRVKVSAGDLASCRELSARLGERVGGAPALAADGPFETTSSTCLLLASRKVARVVEHAANVAGIRRAAGYPAQQVSALEWSSL